MSKMEGRQELCSEPWCWFTAVGKSAPAPLFSPSVKGGYYLLSLPNHELRAGSTLNIWKERWYKTTKRGVGVWDVATRQNEMLGWEPACRIVRMSSSAATGTLGTLVCLVKSTPSSPSCKERQPRMVTRTKNLWSGRMESESWGRGWVYAILRNSQGDTDAYQSLRNSLAHQTTHTSPRVRVFPYPSYMLSQPLLPVPSKHVSALGLLTAKWIQLFL